MKAVVVGCGRVGAGVADELDRAGWQVLIIDLKSAAFDRLPASFTGTALRGDGTDEDVLRRAGAENADLFLALTEGDNRNIMAAQLAVEALDARRVIAKINDPLRAAAYADLGINTLCRTNLMAAAVNDFLGLDLTFGPGMAEATGVHPGGEHHAEAGDPGGGGDVATSRPEGTGGATAGSGAGPEAGGSSTSTIATEAPAASVAAREG